MKIAFYVDNSRYAHIDYSKIEAGNPGMGGTQYLFFTIALYLKKKYTEDSFFILAPIVDSLQNVFDVIRCESTIESIKIAKENNFDILVIRSNEADSKIYETIDFYKQKTICWSHNHELDRINTLISRTHYVIKHICVSKEQLDTLIDHPVYSKSTYIFNGLDFSTLGEINKSITKENVGYIGSITPEKGVFQLIKAWKKVNKINKEAKLIIVGSDNLYRKDKLVKEHSKYYMKCLKYIEKNSLTKSIDFRGVLTGKEKNIFLNEIKIGVASALGKDTFCLSAIEYQYFNAAVVSKNRGGVLDSAQKNKSCLFFNTNRGLSKALLLLLKDEKKCEDFGEYGHRYVTEMFDINKIVEKWYNIFMEIIEDKSYPQKYKLNNILTNKKIFRLINMKIKKIIIFKWLPSLLWYEEFLKRVLKKVLGMK